MDFNTRKFLEKRSLGSDRYGSLVIYPDGARDPMAIAEHEAKKVLKTTEHVQILDLIFHKLQSGKEIILAVYPYPYRKPEQEKVNS